MGYDAGLYNLRFKGSKPPFHVALCSAYKEVRRKKVEGETGYTTRKNPEKDDPVNILLSVLDLPEPVQNYQIVHEITRERFEVACVWPNAKFALDFNFKPEGPLDQEKINHFVFRIFAIFFRNNDFYWNNIGNVIIINN